MLLVFSFQTVVLGFGAILGAMVVFALIALRQTKVGPASAVAEGTVVDFQDEVQHGVGADSMSGFSRLRVRFTTAAGEQITVVTPTGNSLARLQYKVGRRVQVRYDPANPQQITVEAFDSLNRTFILVIFGVVVVGFVLLAFFLWGLQQFLPH